MTPATWYDAAKKLLWPHIAVPLFLVVALDYLELVSGLARVACVSYAGLQFIAFGLGAWASMLMKLDPDSVWAKALELNIVRVFPLLRVGAGFVEWAVSDSPKDVTPAPRGHSSDPIPKGEAGEGEAAPGRGGDGVLRPDPDGSPA